MFEAVLFDLDGTLADTAPDLGAAVNRLLVEEGQAPRALAELRPYTSQGVRGMLRIGFGLNPDDAAYANLAARFLDHYAANICRDTRLFPGMDELLVRLEAAGIPWGVVTNKRERYTTPLMQALGLAERAACVVSGDTTAAAKPSPLPILHACTQIDREPARCLYIGDDKRDIDAGKAAGTRTAAAAYGYLGDCGPVESWQADFLAHQPAHLADYIFATATTR